MKPLKFLSAIYAQDKIDARAAEFARIDTLQGKGERMMAYKQLLQIDRDDLMEKSWLRKRDALLQGSIACFLLAVTFSGLPITLAGVALTPFLPVVVPIGLAAILLNVAMPEIEIRAYALTGQRRQDGEIRAKLANEEAGATLENLGPSAQLSNVLRDFPQLKKRFQDAVLQKAIKNNGETTPVMRLALQK